jgi:hypothetical protein
MSSKIYPNWDFLFENKPSGNPGANPTITNYSASAVNIYNVTSIPVHFDNNNIFFWL